MRRKLPMSMSAVTSKVTADWADMIDVERDSVYSGKRSLKSRKGLVELHPYRMSCQPLSYFTHTKNYLTLFVAESVLLPSPTPERTSKLLPTRLPAMTYIICNDRHYIPKQRTTPQQYSSILYHSASLLRGLSKMLLQFLFGLSFALQEALNLVRISAVVISGILPLCKFMSAGFLRYGKALSASRCTERVHGGFTVVGLRWNHFVPVMVHSINAVL